MSLTSLPEIICSAHIIIAQTMPLLFVAGLDMSVAGLSNLLLDQWRASLSHPLWQPVEIEGPAPAEHILPHLS